MDPESRERLKLALAANRGRAILDQWSRSLGVACGRSIRHEDFVSIDRTRQLKEQFADRLKQQDSSHRLFWNKDDVMSLHRHLSEVSSAVCGMEIVLFSSVDQFIGAVRMSAKQVLQNAASVWAVVGEDLSLASESMDDGMCLEESFYRSDGEYVHDGLYELTTWGRFQRDEAIATGSPT
jgi:hypothetical protein